MTRRAPPLLIASLVAIACAGCDPVFEVCVTVVSCADRDPLTGVHVTIRTYEFDEYTEPDGRACYSSVGDLGARFSVELEKPGYTPKTAGPFTPKSGSNEFHQEICLEPSK